MKKIYAFMVAAIALTAVACNNEAIDEVVGGENIANGDYITTLTVSLDNTRTELADGGKTTWCAGDEISLNGSVFELTDVATGQFSLKEGQDAVAKGLSEYTVLYPANTTTIPATQTATAGSFAHGAALLKAVVTSDAALEGLKLEHAHALLKFTVAADATSVSVLGYTLSGNIKAGTAYYIAVEPKTYSGLTAVVDGVAYKSTISPVALAVCDVLNIGNLEGTNVYLAGEYNDWNSTANMMMKEGSYYALKGVTGLCEGNGKDLFKLVINGSWTGEKDDSNMAAHYMYAVNSNGNGANFTGWGLDTVTPYNVYYLPETNQVTIRKEETTLSIVGSFTNWADGADIDMSLNNGWFVAYNVTIPAGAEWKIRINKNWDISFGGDNLTVGKYIQTNAGASGNFTIAEGTYDIYMSKDTFNMVVVNAGSPRP